MKFLLDANLPRSAVEVYGQYGETSDCRDLGLGDAPDTEVFETAVAKASILVTRDLEFGNPTLFPLERIPALVILRVPSFFTAAQITKVFRDFLSTCPLERLPGRVTVVEIGRIRQRPLHEER